MRFKIAADTFDFKGKAVEFIEFCQILLEEFCLHPYLIDIDDLKKGVPFFKTGTTVEAFVEYPAGDRCVDSSIGIGMTLFFNLGDLFWADIEQHKFLFCATQHARCRTLGIVADRVEVVLFCFIDFRRVDFCKCITFIDFDEAFVGVECFYKSAKPCTDIDTPLIFCDNVAVVDLRFGSLHLFDLDSTYIEKLFYHRSVPFMSLFFC